MGSSAAFTCVAEGDPVPTFQWSFDDLTLADNDKYDITTTSTVSTLTVLEILPSDGSSYTCNATNEHGSDSASAELQVLCKWAYHIAYNAKLSYFKHCLVLPLSNF